MNTQIPREFIVLYNELDTCKAVEITEALKGLIETKLQNLPTGDHNLIAKVEMISLDNDECMVLLDNLGNYKDYDPSKAMLIIFNPSSNDLIGGLCVSMVMAFNKPILYVDQDFCLGIKELEKPLIHCCDYDGSAEMLAIDIVKKTMEIQTEMLGTAVSESTQESIHLSTDELASTPAD